MSGGQSIRDRFELKGRKYIVTGGAMGIGFAITRDICEMGGNVAVLDLRDAPLEDVSGLAEKYNVMSEYVQADVSDESSLRAAFDKAVQALGNLDGIVTAAGQPLSSEDLEASLAHKKTTISIMSYPIAIPQQTQDY